MRHYASLEQRMIASHVDTLPPFTASEDYDMDAQRELYSFIKAFYDTVFADPTLLFRELRQDDAFNNRFNKSSDNKPDLMKYMRKATDEIEKFFFFLMELGKAMGNGSASPKLRIPGKYAGIFSKLGIEIKNIGDGIKLVSKKYGDVELSLIWMARREGMSPFSYSRCIFSLERYDLSENYRALSGAADQYDRLIAYLERSRYRLLRTPDSPSFEYLKGKNGSSPERGGFQYKVNHIGISMNYDGLVKEPASYSICIPSMAKLLDFFPDMEEDLQKFIVLMTKKCDECRYCVQTDKTRKRSLASVAVACRDGKFSLCPYFPGYTYTFDHLDEMIVTYMIKLLDFMDARLDSLVK